MDGSDYAIFIIYIILVILFIILIIWAVLSLTPRTTEGTGKLNDTCSSNSTCMRGLICSNSQCKVPIGGRCNTYNDCTSSATDCFNNICVNTVLSGIGGNPPCQSGLVNDHGICRVPIDGQCTLDSDCVIGSSNCTDGICISNCNNCSSRSGSRSTSSRSGSRSTNSRSGSTGSTNSRTSFSNPTNSQSQYDDISFNSREHVRKISPKLGKTKRNSTSKSDYESRSEFNPISNYHSDYDFIDNTENNSDDNIENDTSSYVSMADKIKTIISNRLSHKN